MQKLGLKMLHLLPPEVAHNMTLKMLSMGLSPVVRASDSDAIKTDLFGGLTTPIGLSAGMDKNAIALPAWRNMGFGFVEVGTVTFEPRDGNCGKRMWRLPKHNSLFNFMGLNNHGYEAVLDNIHYFRMNTGPSSFKIGVSLMSLTANCVELAAMTEGFYHAVDYFTVNVACPNVEHQKPFIEEATEQLQAVIDGAHGKPVLLKLPPMTDMEELRNIVSEMLKLGVSGFVATNTQAWDGHKDMLGLNLNASWPVKGNDFVGGYSGPFLLPITINMVKTIREEAGEGVIVIGVGGIQSGDDAKAVIDAGADAVQLLTGLVYKGHRLIPEIMDTLKQPS